MMFKLMAKVQSFLNYCRWELGISHRFLDPIAQRLPFEKNLG